MKLIFTMPGEWTSPWILLRLLEVVDSDWQASERGFASRSTGAVAQLAMGRPIAGLERVFADGADPTRPPLEEELLAAVARHKAVVQVSVESDPADPLGSLHTALAATNAVIDGGALAVHVATSGLVHGADAYQASLAMALAASGDERIRGLASMVVRYHLGPRPCTVGMHALGRPDAALTGPSDPDRAVAALERAITRPPAAPGPDDRGLPELLKNPFGLVRVPA